MNLKTEVPLALTIQVGMTLKEIENLLIVATLNHTGHNVAASARILGIDRGTLYSKIRKYSVKPSAEYKTEAEAIHH